MAKLSIINCAYRMAQNLTVIKYYGLARLKVDGLTKLSLVFNVMPVIQKISMQLWIFTVLPLIVKLR